MRRRHSVEGKLHDWHVSIIGTRGYPSYYGGFETALRRLAPYLADLGWNVTVYGRKRSIRMNDPATDPRVNSKLTLGIETKSLSTLTFGFFSALHACVHKPDVALVMNVANGFWIPLLRLRGITVVVNVDGIEWERQKWNRFARFVFKIGANLCAHWADRLIADSVEIAKYWQKEFGRTASFIPYGADKPETRRHRASISSREYVLVVARFVPENSIPEFIEAAKILNNKYDVIVVGSSGYGGPIEAAAKALVEGHENVTWLGHVDDHDQLLSLWSNAAVYFHGHTVGGTNPALVQAMMCGAPVIARDTKYNREVLGSAGLYVSGYPEEIAESITSLLENPKRRMTLAKASRKRAEQLFTWENVCQSYNDILSEVIGKTVPRSAVASETKKL